MPLARGWSRVICVASGPSLTREQCARIGEAQRDGWRVIAVNGAWSWVPYADALFAADDRWWVLYRNEITLAFRGECWTADRITARRHGLQYIDSVLGDRLPRDPDFISRGGNSGHMAIQLAYRFGAEVIVLAGYDMQRTGGQSHCLGDQPRVIGRE